MSSHHIIRENQEPALLIANAHAITFEKIQELLEWMPTVVVVSTEVEQVIAWGIKIDVVIAPISEVVPWRDRLIDQIPIRIISFNQGDDPIITALYFLVASKATAVNCLVGNQDDLKRIDLTVALDMEAFTDNKLWSCIKKGTFEKWLPAGTALYLAPDTMKNEFQEFAAGSYQTTKDGIVSLKSTQPFWIGEELS